MRKRITVHAHELCCLPAPFLSLMMMIVCWTRENVQYGRTCLRYSIVFVRYTGYNMPLQPPYTYLGNTPKMRKEKKNKKRSSKTQRAKDTLRQNTDYTMHNVRQTQAIESNTIQYSNSPTQTQAQATAISIAIATAAAAAATNTR